jgi:hypothetical protein
MYAEISAAIQSAKALGELVKAAHGLANYNEFVTAVYEVNAKLMDATAVALASQEKQSSLVNRVAELEDELRELKNLERDAQRYQLTKFAFGGYAYSIKAGMENAEPPHYLCAACMNLRKKSILQPYGEVFLRCSLCNEQIQISNEPPIRVESDYNPFDPRRF